MFRKYVIITLAVAMFLGTNGCTSKKADGDASAAASSSDMDGLEIADATEDNSDLSTKASTDSGASSDSTAASDSGAADLGIDDLAPEEKLPQDAPAVADNSVAPSDLTETPPPSDMAALDSGSTPTPEPSPVDSSTPTETLPPSDMAANMDPGGAPMDSGAAAGMGSSDAPPAPKASLQKVKSAPFRVGKILANAVYVARQGDSVEDISQKVFGTTKRVKDICRVNSFNCSRKVKVGDKFYYNSPQRPTDDTAVKIFYEDAGLQPEIYTAKAGDNIRSVGKDLLGHKNSWMELWVTNEIESKQGLDEGTQLKYWPKSEVAEPTQTMAQADASAGAVAPPDQMAPPPAQDEMSAQTPPPPDQALADNGAVPPPPPPTNDLPPAPDSGMGAAAGSVEPPPPPPPPPPTAQSQPVDGSDPTASLLGTSDPMVLGIGCVLMLAAVALFISIRKKRSRRQIDFNTSTQTQID
jgi:hypothetical protein